MSNNQYQCLVCKQVLIHQGGGLSCESGHSVPYVTDSSLADIKVPVFACQDDNANEYSVAQAAQIHDNALAWVFNTFGGSEAQLRVDLMAKLEAKPGQKVLITGVGAGNDLPHLAELIGKKGSIVALDFAKQMLLAAVKRVQGEYQLAQHDIEFCVADATDLPFADNSFDCAYHFGGLNLFPSIKRGITEMDRVVKAGGKVVVCDEGLAPWIKPTQLGKMLINNNPLYAYDAPLEHIPPTARDVNLSWCVADCFYVIDFVVADNMRDIDLNVLHLGTRGGTIVKRFEGQLEGVDPALKDKVYQKAAQLGVSRVELLEKLLDEGLSRESSN